jgi:hypothetical protein
VMLMYKGRHRPQYGKGLGNIIGKLFRAAHPFLRKGAEAIAPTVARMGVDMIKDSANGTDALESVKKHAKRAGEDVVDAIVRKKPKRQNGTGHINRNLQQRNRKQNRASSKRGKRRKKQNRQRSAFKIKSTKPRKRKGYEKINDIFDYGY